MYLLTNVITMLIASTSSFSASMFRVHKCTTLLIPHGSINEYTYENGVKLEIKSLQPVETVFFHNI